MPRMMRYFFMKDPLPGDGPVFQDIQYEKKLTGCHFNIVIFIGIANHLHSNILH